MTKNCLRLLDMDEHRRPAEEKRWAGALRECDKRGCVLDLASSDVCVYLEGAKSMDDTRAVSRATDYHQEGWPFYDKDSLEQHPPEGVSCNDAPNKYWKDV